MTIKEWFSSLDPTSILIGMGIVGVIWLLMYLINRFVYPKKEYTLPQLQAWVSDAHKKMNEANDDLINLSKAFKAIEGMK